MKFLKNQFMPTILVAIYLISMAYGMLKIEETRREFIERSSKETMRCENYEGKYDDEQLEEWCDYILNTNHKYIEFMSFYSMHDSSMFLPLSSSFISIILIVLCSCYYPCRHLKNNVITNYVSRESYSKYRKKIFLNTWFVVSIIPILMIIRIILCYLYTGNWDLYYGIDVGNSLPVYLISTIVISTFATATLTNISLIASRKQHNFVLASVVSFLTIIAVELSFECILCPILNTITHSDIGHMFNILSYGIAVFNAYGYLPPIIFSLSTATISYIIARLAYKDKEKLIIDCEAN